MFFLAVIRDPGTVDADRDLDPSSPKCKSSGQTGRGKNNLFFSAEVINWVNGRFGDKTFGRQNFLDDHLGIRVGRLGDSNWTFERQTSRRMGDKNEALRL